MASAGLSISSTTGSVGIGADAPANLGNSGLFVSGSIRTAENYMITDNKKLSWGGGNTSIVGREGTSSDFLAFKTSGTEALRIVSSGYVGIGTSTPSATLHLYGPTNSISSGLIIGSSDSSAQRLFIGPVGQVSARIRPMVANGQLIIESSNGSRIMSIFSGSNTVGIGLPFSGSTPPSTTLDLAGTLKIADGGEACDTNRLGAIKYDTANFYVCKNTSLGWEPLSTSTSSTTPSIDSGLSGSIVYRDEYGYLKANNTFSISSTTGSVGIGAGAPASVGTNGLYVGGGT